MRELFYDLLKASLHGSIVILAVLLLRQLLKKAPRSVFCLLWLLAVMTVLAAAFVAYMEFFPFPAEVDAENLQHALKNSYTLFGALVGMLIVYAVDKKRDFTTKGVWYAQVIKAVGGLALVLAVKEGLKAPLELVFGTHMAARAVRYCAIVLVAGILWPMTFARFAKLGRKDEA